MQIGVLLKSSELEQIPRQNQHERSSETVGPPREACHGRVFAVCGLDFRLDVDLASHEELDGSRRWWVVVAAVAVGIGEDDFLKVAQLQWREKWGFARPR
jgi:hypothetical protein